MYLQVISRPDISYAVNIAARALENPSDTHWIFVKTIMRYLKGALVVGLRHCKEGDVEMNTDAYYTEDVITRKSTSVTVCLYCLYANASIIWQSKR